MKTLYKLLLPITMMAALSCNAKVENKSTNSLENALAKHHLSAYSSMMEHVCKSQLGHFEDKHSDSVFSSRCYPTFRKNCETCQKYAKTLESYLDSRIDQAKKAKEEFSKDSENFKKLAAMEAYLRETKKEYFPEKK